MEAPAADAPAAEDAATAQARPLERMLLVAAVVLPAGYVFWRISDAYRSYMDDFLQFATAQSSGLSWELLGLNVFQHFSPVNRLGHLLLLRVGGFSLTAGMLASALLVVALQASLLWLLRELRVSVGRTLLCLVAVGFSVTVLDTAVWTDAAFHIFPTLAITTAVVAAHVRAVRTGRRSWHVATVVLFALGPLTQERALFALPMVVLADWFLLGAGQPVATRLRRLRAGWLPLAAMTVIALAWAAFIYLKYAGGAAAHPTLGTTLRTGLGALTQGIFPPWTGLPLSSLAPVPVQLALLVLMVAVAAALVWLRRRNADPIGFLAASFLLYYGFLGVSPLLIPDTIESTALRLHNATYLLVPTVVAVASLSWRRAGEAPAPRRMGDPSAGARFAAPWPAAVTALVLAVALAFTGGHFTRTHWAAERDAHAYLSNIAAGEDEWAADDVTLLPLLVPPTVVSYWAELYGRQEYFLRFHQRTFVPQPLGEHPVVLDAEGRVRPVALRTEAELTLDESAACGALQRTIAAAPEPVSGEPLFVQLTYRASEPEPVRATSLTGTTPDAAYAGNWRVPLPSGEHTVVIPLYTSDVPGVLLDWLTPASETCVLQASIVRPVFSDGGTCIDMDRYGKPTESTSCPVGRRP